MDSIYDFLKYYIPEKDVPELAKGFSTRKNIAKNELLLAPGISCDFLGFIIKGLFRVYFYDYEGKEITVWFSLEGMVITDMLAFYSDTKAQFYVQAIEDSEIIIITKEKLESSYAHYPSLIEFGRKFAEEAIVMLMERTLTLQTKTAEDRYKDLLEQPELLQRIPLKHLATYLGITDTSLSRIRRNIK
ncbi:MAG: Crp/Fnr family transcriptional regulator [Saprospiraceae bacterium]|nr:Crp/Fnr family transcriptional regulator [Saprospiraceae bacterium]